MNIVSVDYLLQVFKLAVPKRVQTVLGQETYSPGDLVDLCSDWKDPSWGVYLDVLTRTEQSPGFWYSLYVGSTCSLTGKKGFWNRIGSYFRWLKKQPFPWLHDKIIKNGYAHARAVLQPGTKIQLVKLAKFPYTIAKTYVLLLETIMMVYLQALNLDGPSGNTPKQTIDWVEQLQSIDLLQTCQDIGLNRSWPLNQVFGAKPRSAMVCSHCGDSHNLTSDGRNRNWFNLDPTKPGVSMLCGRCYNYRRFHGQLPNAMITRMTHYFSQRKFEKRWSCDGCQEPLSLQQANHIRHYFEASPS